MHPSHPGDPKARKGARKPEGDPLEERPDERLTVEIRGGDYGADIEITEEDETPSISDDRDTMPPPLPVAEYVQTMMQQADTDDDPEVEPPPSKAPMSWRGEPPVSWRARTPMDSASRLGGLRLQDPAEGEPPRSARGIAGAAPVVNPNDDAPTIELSTEVLRAHLDDDEFERRPLSLHAEGTPAEVDEIPVTTGSPAGPPVTTASPPRRVLTPLPPAPRRRSDLAATVPRIVLSSPLSHPSPSESITRPVPSSYVPEEDPEIDALPFDDLVAASHRSVPPPTVVAPQPLRMTPSPPAPQAAPKPGGLRLGKEPLSSFPPVLTELDVDDGSLPAVLDVARAFGAGTDDSADERDAVLPGSDIWSARTARPPSGSPPGQEGDDLWVFQKSRYDETNEVTTVGSFEDDLDIDLEPVDEIQARFEEGDFAGALLLAERILAIDASDERARAAAESARERLIADYAAELGGRHQILKLAMASDEIRWLSLDHRAGFLLSCVDGRMTVEELIDVSCMSELDALRILCDLRDRGAIAMEVDQARSTRR